VEVAGVVTLLTAVYGGYDTLQALPDGHGFDAAVAVTDDPRLEADGWDVRHVASGDGFRLAGKAPKLTPFDFVDDDTVVWIDGSITICDVGFRRFVLDALEGHELVALDHPDDRDCLYQEATFCQDWVQNVHMPLREQTAHYRAQGMPDHFGLWACGVLGWQRTAQSVAFGRAWLEENRRWSTRDQVSFPYLLWSMPLKFGVLPGNQLDNRYLSVAPHNVLR